MALIRYKCKLCNKQKLVFSGEEGTRLQEGYVHDYVAEPPDPTVVHSSSGIMVEYQLDSLESARKINQIRNSEAAEEKLHQIMNKERPKIS